MGIGINSGNWGFARPIGPSRIAASPGGRLSASSGAGPTPPVSGQVKLADQLGIKMITIPAGEFIFQGISGVRHNGYKIAETEFTNGQFKRLLELMPDELARMVKDPQKKLESSLAAVDPNYKEEAEDCPMVGLSQIEYAGIAKLLGLRLLTELEWERAAAGKDGRAYSFGNQFDQSKVTFNGKGTRSVYAHREAATPEGVFDLSGNVWEWTSSYYGKIYLHDPKNPRFPIPGANMILRGGAWNRDIERIFQVAYRYADLPELQYDSVGVRFAKDIQPDPGKI